MRVPTSDGIVLCGGRSTRMGQDKGALPFGGEIDARANRADPGGIADEVIVVGRRDQQVPAGVTMVTIPSKITDRSPASPPGLAASTHRSEHRRRLRHAADQSGGAAAAGRRMIDDHDACVAIADGHASALCGVYRSRVAAEAQALLDSGERRVMRLLDQMTTKRVDAAVFRDIDPDLDTFISVDTPEKYAGADQALRTLSP